MIGSIIWAIVFGLVIGALGRLVVPGRQNISIGMTWLVGVVAALLGTLVSYLFGLSKGGGFHWWEHVLQVVFAAVGVWLVMSRGTAPRNPTNPV